MKYMALRESSTLRAFYFYGGNIKNMNEIERKYYDAFEKYLKTNPTIAIYNSNSEKQIANIKLGFVSSLEHDIEMAKQEDDIEFVEYAKKYKTDSIFAEISIASKELRKVIPKCFIKNVIPAAFVIDCPDKDISGYKPDFLISFSDYSNLIFAIEIDGHQWHEKTKEQASNDRKKDRAYLKNMAIPIRFTGSDVYHDALSCVRETMEISLQYLIYQFFINFGIKY